VTTAATGSRLAAFRRPSFTTPPNGSTYVWGRGAIDFKGQGIAHLVALLALNRSGVPLSRDVVFIANADEELLGTRGAAVFVKRHADLLRDVE
jgi:acetylornithine deacetylase/succinyl-diaminopimelate desuccinylase-like protein